MKKNIITKLASLVFALAIFASCDTDAEGTIYNEVGVGVAFASTKMNVEIVAQDNGKIRVPIYRGNTASEATVAILLDEATTQKGVFSLTNPSLTFAKGEAVVYAELDFGSIDKLGATTKYEMELTIADEQQLSPTKNGKLKVAAQRKLTWKFYGTGVYISEIFGQSWSQPIEKAEEGNIYRLPDCITEGYPIVFSLSEDGNSLAGWATQETGYKNATYGMTYFTALDMEREGKTLSFLINYTVSAGTFGKFVETLEMPE